MTEFDDIRRELSSELPDHEVAAVLEVAELLRSQRPVPRAGFRSALRAQVAAPTATTRWRPAHLRLTIGAYLASGAALLAVAALGVAGVGPLA